MDFNWSPEQEKYRMEVRSWLEANRPRTLAKNDDPEFGGDDAQWKRLKEWHKRLYAAGWAGLTWPKEYGGRGATFVEQVIFQQELGRLGLPMGCNDARRYHDRPRADAVGNRRSEEALPAADSRRR